MRYVVTRQRAYWVSETQVVEADSEEEAEDMFLDCFDPSLKVMGVCLFGNEQLSTPIDVMPERRTDAVS